MLSTERPEFETQIAKLIAGTNRKDVPELREAYWVGLIRMPLADVVRVIDHHLTLERDGPTPRLDPGQFWKISRELKAQRQAADHKRLLQLEPPRDHDQFDKWDRIANLKLLRHVCHHARRYGSDRELVQVLLEQRRMWASEMREADLDGSLPPEGDDSWWDDRLRRAESQIDEIIERRRAQEAA